MIKPNTYLNLRIQINYKKASDASNPAHFSVLSPGLCDHSDHLDCACTCINDHDMNVRMQKGDINLASDMPHFSSLVHCHECSHAYVQDQEDKELDMMIQRLENRIRYFEKCNNLLKNAISIDMNL